MSHQGHSSTNESRRMGPAAGSSQPEQSGNPTGLQGTQPSGETTQTVKETAGQYAEQGRERVASRLSSQKMRLADELGSISEAIRAAGRQLQEQDQSSVAQYANQGADQVEHFQQYLREREVSELVDEVESFARQRPAIFLGGAFGLGLLAARFLKS